MIADKFSLDKYVIKRKLGQGYIISSAMGQRLFQAVRPLLKKEILLYDCASPNVPLLTIKWKLRKGFIVYKYNYTVIDRSYTILANLDGERSLTFSLTFSIKDMYNKEIGQIVPDQIGYSMKYINVVLGAAKKAVFYRSTIVPISYTMDLCGDKEKSLDRKLAIAIAVILASCGLTMQKSSDQIDWRQHVCLGDEMYKIKRR